MVDVSEDANGQVLVHPRAAEPQELVHYHCGSIFFCEINPTVMESLRNDVRLEEHDAVREEFEEEMYETGQVDQCPACGEYVKFNFNLTS